MNYSIIIVQQQQFRKTMQRLRLSATMVCVFRYIRHHHQQQPSPQQVETLLYLWLLCSLISPKTSFLLFATCVPPTAQIYSQPKNGGTTKPSQSIGRSTAIKKIFLINFLHTEAFNPAWPRTSSRLPSVFSFSLAGRIGAGTLT